MCDYKQVFQTYGIVCNNSVNGGDCYGETGCGCNVSEQDLYQEWCKQQKQDKKQKGKKNKENTQTNTQTFSDYKKNRNISHTDYKCIYCKILVCECCYSECPGCGYSNDDEYVSIEDSYTCMNSNCNGSVDCLCKIYEYKEDPHKDYKCDTCSRKICACCFQNCPHCN